MLSRTKQENCLTTGEIPVNRSAEETNRVCGTDQDPNLQKTRERRTETKKNGEKKAIIGVGSIIEGIYLSHLVPTVLERTVTSRESLGDIRNVKSETLIDLRSTHETVKNAGQSSRQKKEKRETKSKQVLLYLSLHNRLALMTTKGKNESPSKGLLSLCKLNW